MSGKTDIDWAEKSWTVVTGCSKCSPGCLNCYAAKNAATRLKHHPNYEGLAIKTDSGYDWVGEVRCNVSELEKPLHWKKPSRIFVAPTGDLFHENMTQMDLFEVFQVIAEAKQHTYIVLTKRPERMCEFICNKNFFGHNDMFDAWKHVWLGVTVCTPDERYKIDLLRQIPAAVRFISFEPLLEDMGAVNLDGIDWVIAGCESGPKRRHANVEWFDSLMRQCVNADVPFFLKQTERNGQLLKMPKFCGRVWDQYPEARQ